MTDHYSTLGLDSSNKAKITLEEVKAAYKKKVLTEHPDKGGTKERFQALQTAYEVLSDTGKRASYDRGGVSMNSGAYPHTFDFDGLFSGLFNKQSRQAPSAAPKIVPLIITYEVTLEQLFKGGDHIVSCKRHSPCSSCDGKSGGVKCSDCNGTGTRTITNRVGPNMIQQMCVHCVTCNGGGIDLSSGCQSCSRAGTTLTEAKIQFTIHPGTDPSRDNHDTVIISGEGHWNTALQIRQPVTIKLILKPHPMYTLTPKLDLTVKISITLSEALTGFKKSIPFLDGEDVVISSYLGAVMNPSSITIVEDHGWPIKRYSKSGRERSNLLVSYDIKFPESGSLDSVKRGVLKDILGP